MSDRLGYVFRVLVFVLLLLAGAGIHGLLCCMHEVECLSLSPKWAYAITVATFLRRFMVQHTEYEKAAKARSRKEIMNDLYSGRDSTRARERARALPRNFSPQTMFNWTGVQYSLMREQLADALSEICLSFNTIAEETRTQVKAVSSLAASALLGEEPEQ
jgi:hypothetical protein